MESQENIHYRMGGRLTHCGVECLPQGQDIPRIIIESIEYKESEEINGRRETGVWIAHFAPNQYTKLPFILNATNRKRLIKQFPECDGYPARLKNIAVRLTKERCRDVQDGGETWGLRISRLGPASEEEMAKWMVEHGYAQARPAQKKVITSDKVQIIIDWARKGGKTIEDVAEMYDFESDEVKKEIAEALDLPKE